MNLLGYAVEKIENSQPGQVAYLLHGPRATYTLIRNINQSYVMYATNSNGNVCGVKGNYTFSDRRGYLETVNNGFVS